MLSDEEKEILIKKLRYCEQEYEQNGYLSVGKFKAIKEAANIIEKQSKEIEELKYKVREHICIEAHEQVKQLYVPKDKIKAKIEEIKNECKYCDFTDEFCQELLQNNNCTQGNTLKVLQSLLEKE